MKFPADMVACRLAILFALLSFVLLSPGCGTESTPKATADDAPVGDEARADGVSANVPKGNSSEPASQAPLRPQVIEPAGPDRAVPANDVVQPVFRPSDDRPVHDAGELERAGIRRYESTRLILYTDIPPDDAQKLPPLVDALYDELVAYFGELPPARDGASFQMTGYLMKDADRFQSTGLLPDDLPPFHHGRHRGQRFWMREQDYDYYRRHLLLHEATHCFMTRLPGSVGPDWYMEGMAELFGTHRVDEEGVRFRVMPGSPEATAGSGRITLVRQDVAAGEFKSLDDVFALTPGEYLQNNAYAWSWAACDFFDAHPRYRDRFRSLGAPALRQRMPAAYDKRFADDATELAIEWALFAHTLRYGYDRQAAAVVFRAAVPLADGGATAVIDAARGWQSSGFRLEAGTRYRVVADGRFTLADEPVPWVSDAGGIHFDYCDRRPLGQLLAAVVVDDRSAAPDPAGGLLSPIEVGREATIEVPATGTLFLRINDHWDRLDDNRGKVTVTVRQSAE